MTQESNNYETTKFCKHCGNELRPEWKFCQECGDLISDSNLTTANETPISTPLDSPQDSQNPIQVTINPSKQSMNKKLLFIILASASAFLIIATLMVIVVLIIVAVLIFGNQNQLKVYDSYYSFTDEELIDYVNDNSSAIYIDSKGLGSLLGASDGTKTYYSITYNGDNGVLTLDHDKKTNKICAIGISYFDNEYDACAILIWIGKEIDPQFFTDSNEVATDIVVDNAYVSSKMTLIGTDGRYILFPNGYLAELIE